MKRKILFLVIILLNISCNAQNQIINIKNQGYPEISGAYYKDIDNELNAFEGTWLFTNGNVSLKIVLVKKTMARTGNYFEDILVGEYQYIVNNIEKINTLSSLSINYTDQYQHHIWGNSLLKNRNRPFCTDCAENEMRALISIGNPTKDFFQSLVLKKLTINGTTALRILIFGGGGGKTYEGDTPPVPGLHVPSGEYTFIKQ